jgi:hypothetical protein
MLQRALGETPALDAASRVACLGNEFNLVWFPQEVTYPFPTIFSFFRLKPQRDINYLLTQKVILRQPS